MSSRFADDLAARSMQGLEAELAIPADLEVTLLDQITGDLTAQSMQALEEDLVIPDDLEATLLDRVTGDSHTKAKQARTSDVVYDGTLLPKRSPDSTKTYNHRSKRLYLGLWIGSIIAITATWINANVSHVTEADARVEQDAGQAEEYGARILKQAKEKLSANDIDGAHDLIQRIPDTSPAYGDRIFKDIEHSWTEITFARVDQELDIERKKSILRTIISTPTISQGQRQDASYKLENLQANRMAAPVAIALNSNQSPQAKKGAPKYVFAPSRRFASFDGPMLYDEPLRAMPVDRSNSAPRKPEEKRLPLSEAERNALEDKVFSGKASIEEIRQLVTICSDIGDIPCHDQAKIILKKRVFSEQFDSLSRQRDPLR